MKVRDILSASGMSLKKYFQNFLNKKKPDAFASGFWSDPAGIRTQDPYIKSVLLYQLSYGILSILRFFA
jgi:hypothetical protein